MGQVSPKSSWERTSWGEREGENFYKRKGGATGDGIQKNWEKRLREEQERESCNSIIGLRVFSFQSYSLYLGKAVLTSIKAFLFIIILQYVV